MLKPTIITKLPSIWLIVANSPNIEYDKMIEKNIFENSQGCNVKTVQYLCAVKIIKYSIQYNTPVIASIKIAIGCGFTNSKKKKPENKNKKKLE